MMLAETRTYEEILADLRQLLDDPEIVRFKKTDFGYHVFCKNGSQRFCSDNMNDQTIWFDSYQTTDFGWVLSLEGMRYLCDKEFNYSDAFDYTYRRTSFGFVLFYKNGTKKLCWKLMSLSCSEAFTGGYRIREDGEVVYWNAPKEINYWE